MGVQLGLQVFHQLFALTLPNKGHLPQELLAIITAGAGITIPATAQALQKQANAFLKQRERERGVTYNVLLGVEVKNIEHDSAWVVWMQ